MKVKKTESEETKDMEEKDIVAVNEMNDSRIRNTDEIHFDDRYMMGITY